MLRLGGAGAELELEAEEGEGLCERRLRRLRASMLMAASLSSSMSVVITSDPLKDVCMRSGAPEGRLYRAAGYETRLSPRPQSGTVCIT